MEVPPLMAKLPKDNRGYPIFWTAHVKPDGQPDFRILEMDRVFKALKQRLCGMCGHHIDGQSYCAITTRYNIETERRMTDPPMHEKCVRYALEVCPYLSRPNARRSGKAMPDDPSYGYNREPEREKPTDSVLVWFRSYDGTWREDLRGFQFGKPFKVETLE